MNILEERKTIKALNQLTSETKKQILLGLVLGIPQATIAQEMKVNQSIVSLLYQNVVKGI